MRRAISIFLAFLPAGISGAAEAQQKAFSVEENRIGFVVVSPPQNNVFTAAPVRSANATEPARGRRPRGVSSGAFFEGPGPAAETPQATQESQPHGSAPAQPHGAGPEGEQARAPASPEESRESARAPGAEGMPPAEDREDREPAAGERSAERPAAEPAGAEGPEG